MKTILIVDGDKENLTAAKNTLSGVYKVIDTPSGEEALNFLESDSCDLILLDINMPVMDGFEMMRKIKENEVLSKIPVVVLTGNDDAETETRCLEAGAMDFIAKPFVPAVMLSRIERILELEDMHRQLADKLEQKIEEVEDMRNKSGKDVLTGLWNRGYAAERVNAIVENGGAGALFMMDMDFFKGINDFYGHMEGDNALKMLADAIRKNASKEDVLCRFGGDEFMMFLSGMTSKTQIGQKAGDIIRDVCAEIASKGYETNTSVSIGIARIPEDAADFDGAYNAADKALYYVKQNGRNSYHFYGEQKAGEDARGKVLVDLEYLREIMDRADSGKGAYQLDLSSFHHVYNFIRRFAVRSGKDVPILLFTVNPEGNLGAAEREEAMSMLEQAIYTSLRRADVSTRYSGKQVIVILMDAASDNGDQVAGRILKCFGTLYTKAPVNITYELARIESDEPAVRQGR